MKYRQAKKIFRMENRGLFPAPYTVRQLKDALIVVFESKR